MLSPPPTDRAAALARDRKRRSRARRARGRSLIEIETNYDKLVTALLRASDAAVQAGAPPRLTEAGSYDRSAVAAAAAEVLEEWTKLWL
jgi:transposase